MEAQKRRVQVEEGGREHMRATTREIMVGREKRGEGGREGEREGRNGGREGGREGVEEGREGGKEGREGGREGRKEGEGVGGCMGCVQDQSSCL